MNVIIYHQIVLRIRVSLVSVGTGPLTAQLRGAHRNYFIFFNVFLTLHLDISV